MKIISKIKPNIRTITKRRWYKQGGAIWLFYGFTPYLSMNETLGYDRNIYFQCGDRNIAYFDREKEYRLLWQVIQRQKRDSATIDRRIALWREQMQRVLIEYQRRFQKPISSWSDAELRSFLAWHMKNVLAHWITAVLIEWSDPDGEKALQQEITLAKCNLSAKEIQTLIAPTKLSFVQEELESRLQLVKRLATDRDITQGVKRHRQKFSWYKNNWAYVHILDDRYFYHIIQKDVKKLKSLKTELVKINRTIRKNRRQIQKILKAKHVPKKLDNVFYLFRQMSDWRDERKKYATNITNAHLFQILKRLAKENHITQQLAGMVTPIDLTGWRLTSAQKQTLKKRLAFSAFLCTADQKCGWLYGREAKQLYHVMTQRDKGKAIHGTIANAGSVIGRVKIVETKADFKKFKTGDIIVAHMTRPEYVPLLKRAAAIVTDEGGLTCHAAIISRELNIPCVIGTQTATHVLKDGDRVEVDANKGNIIKR